MEFHGPHAAPFVNVTTGAPTPAHPLTSPSRPCHHGVTSLPHSGGFRPELIGAAVIPSFAAIMMVPKGRIRSRPRNLHATREKKYNEKIRPRLAEFPVSAISAALGVSRPHATDIRAGRRIPHPRHWLALAKLADSP
jgi:hypothetical protein